MLTVRPSSGVLELYSRQPHVLRVAPAVPSHYVQYMYLLYRVEIYIELYSTYCAYCGIAARGIIFGQEKKKQTNACVRGPGRTDPVWVR